MGQGREDIMGRGGENRNVRIASSCVGHRNNWREYYLEPERAFRATLAGTDRRSAETMDSS